MQQAVAAAKEALQAARAQLGASQQRMQAACAALAALPPDSGHTQPSSSAAASSRKRRVVLSDSEGEGDAADEDAGMQSSDEEEREAQPAPSSRLRTRSKTAAQQHGSGSSLEEAERELDHEEECLQVPPCSLRMPSPLYLLLPMALVCARPRLMLYSGLQALEQTVNAGAVEEDASISAEKHDTSQRLDKAERALQK